MAHFRQSDDYRRDELIRVIEHSVGKQTLQVIGLPLRLSKNLKPLYYDISTKNYINEQ